MSKMDSRVKKSNTNTQTQNNTHYTNTRSQGVGKIGPGIQNAKCPEKWTGNTKCAGKSDRKCKVCRKIGPEMQNVPEMTNKKSTAKHKTLRTSNNTWVDPVNGPFPPERPVSTGQGVRIAVISRPQSFASRSYERFKICASQSYEHMKSMYVHGVSPFSICITILRMPESMHAKSAASRQRRPAARPNCRWSFAGS